MGFPVAFKGFGTPVLALNNQRLKNQVRVVGRSTALAVGASSALRCDGWQPSEKPPGEAPKLRGQEFPHSRVCWESGRRTSWFVENNKWIKI